MKKLILRIKIKWCRLMHKTEHEVYATAFSERYWRCGQCGCCWKTHKSANEVASQSGRVMASLIEVTHHKSHD